MGFFRRIFNMGRAEANSALDSIEDPTKMTQQGIRDMKVDLDKSVKALAEVRALTIRAKNDVNNARNKMKEYEGKAIMLLKRAGKGLVEPKEADRLATVALQKKDEYAENLKIALGTQKTYDAQVNKLNSSVNRLKTLISQWENQAKTLKARAKVSEVTKNVNKQLAGIDSSSTVAMLERMKEKVEQQEALAESYSDIAYENRSLDEEIDSVLESSTESDALAALKAKLSGDAPKAIE